MKITLDVTEAEANLLSAMSAFMGVITKHKASQLSNKIDEAIRATIPVQYDHPPYDFDATVERFRSGELKASQWNFCINRSKTSFAAYIMGEGAEQCLAVKRGFNSEQEIKDLYNSLGVERILSI